MTALICGSFAYDNIMVFQDRFKNHIIPDQVHLLNVCFTVPKLRREFGGCAGNIAYGLKRLGEEPLPMGTVGKDFDPYAYWMDKNKINRAHVKVIEQAYTAQAFITTDLDDNQITAFHPGAMDYAQKNKVTDAEGISIGIVSPDGRAGMIEHADQFTAAKIPFIFDPGQGLPLFRADELKHFIVQANWIAVNNYEWHLLSKQTGLTQDQITRQVAALIVTQGGAGSQIYTQDKQYHIPSVKPAAIVDPTGCGDAYRAGLLYGLMRGLDWETTGRIAALMGTIKIEHHGTQNYRFSMVEFKTRYRGNFGTTWP